MAARINVVFPDEVLEQIRSLVPAGQRTEFVVEATRERLVREQQRRALADAAGCWDDPTQQNLESAEAVRGYLEETRRADLEHVARLEALRGSSR